MGQLRNQLKDITFDSITAANVQTVGGRVYADAKARADVDDLVNIKDGWQAVHAPTYGQPIPSSGSLPSVVGAEDVLIKILAPTANEVYRITGFYGVNTDAVGGGPAAVQFFVSDLSTDIPMSGIVILPTTVATFVPISQDIPLMIDANVTIYGQSDVAGVTMGAVAIKVVQ